MKASCGEEEKESRRLKGEKSENEIEKSSIAGEDSQGMRKKLECRYFYRNSRVGQVDSSSRGGKKAERLTHSNFCAPLTRDFHVSSRFLESLHPPRQ